jgi:hypothetical protein
MPGLPGNIFESTGRDNTRGAKAQSCVSALSGFVQSSVHIKSEGQSPHIVEALWKRPVRRHNAASASIDRLASFTGRSSRLAAENSSPGVFIFR